MVQPLKAATAELWDDGTGCVGDDICGGIGDSEKVATGMGHLAVRFCSFPWWDGCYGNRDGSSGAVAGPAAALRPAQLR